MVITTFFCEPGGIRTPNLLIRSQVHYPVMLRVLRSEEFFPVKSTDPISSENPSFSCECKSIKFLRINQLNEKNWLMLILFLDLLLSFTKTSPLRPLTSMQKLILLFYLCDLSDLVHRNSHQGAYLMGNKHPGIYFFWQFGSDPEIHGGRRDLLQVPG